jgi:hypothetical protein
MGVPTVLSSCSDEPVHRISPHSEALRPEGWGFRGTCRSRPPGWLAPLFPGFFVKVRIPHWRHKDGQALPTPSQAVKILTNRNAIIADQKQFLFVVTIFVIQL